MKKLYTEFCNYFLISTLLKIKNESNSTYVTFNSFLLIKNTFSSWVDFYRIIDLKKVHSNLSLLNGLKPHKNQKRSKRSFSLSLWNMQSDLCVWHYCSQRPGLHRSWTRSFIPSSGNDTECANHSANKTLLFLKQREIYRQTGWKLLWK